ncbi:hypothetical protein CKJ65_18670 [Mycobacterium intracellulare]|nr:hypothetical protein CKJ65_18670 [Mycobacterium intracellulare]
MPFGVYLLQPPNARVGFLIVERVGGRTLARSFRTVLVKHFKTIYPNHILALARTAQTDAWREAEQQGEAVTVRRIIVVHRGIETSQMADFGIGGSRRPVGEYSRILNFKEQPESANVLGRVRRKFRPDRGVDATGGTISTTSGGVVDDGGADEGEVDEVNEIIAEISTPSRGKQTIRYSGARPPAIKYPIDVGPDDDDLYAVFRRSAGRIAMTLAQETDCRLEEGWDTEEWQDTDSLPKWEVQGFGQVAAPPEQSD